MARSSITVYHRDGSPASGVGVSLGFGSGTTEKFYTNSRGEAVVEHSSTGDAAVYVRGDRCGTFRAPGVTVVKLR